MMPFGDFGGTLVSLRSVTLAVFNRTCDGCTGLICVPNLGAPFSLARSGSDGSSLLNYEPRNSQSL